MDKELDDYFHLVGQAMTAAQYGESRGPRLFDNLGVEHARIVIEAMLRVARVEVCIYAKKMNARVFEFTRLCDFLARSPLGRVRIIVEDLEAITDPESALYRFDAAANPRMTVRTTSYRLRHMTIVDGFHLRVERSQDHRSAIVGFGTGDLAEKAQKLFDKLWIDAGAGAAEAAIGLDKSLHAAGLDTGGGTIEASG